MKKYIFILILVSAIAAFLLPFRFLLNFAHDDSFFYIKTADNLSKGLGSTFDGVNLTNGYHPLYFMVLVILYIIPNMISNPSPEFIYRLTVLFHLSMLILSFFILNESLKTMLKEKYDRLISFVIFSLLSSLVLIRDFGLESHLACLIVSSLLYLKSKEISNGDDFTSDKSVLFALLFMTRTDFIYSVIPAALIADILTGRNKKRYAVTSVSVLTAIIFVYYSVNYFAFGYIETISGKLLNAFPRILIGSNINNLLTDKAKLYNQFARIIFVLFSTAAFAYYYYKNIRKDENERKYLLFLLSFGAGSLLFTLIHLLFNNYGIREWYMTLPVFISSVFIGLMSGRRRPVGFSVLFLSLAVLLYVFSGSRVTSLKYVSGYEYAKALERTTDKNDFIYQIDYCGVIGFFSGRNVINGDGLISGFEYYDCVKEKKIDDFLARNNVKYYSTYSSRDILTDSVYIDDNFSDKVNGKIFSFGKSSLVLQMPFRWNHIAFDMEGKWYLFKLK